MSDDIVVVGAGGKSLRVSPDQLKGAVRAFEKSRPALSPSASLRWYFIPGSSARGVALWLRSNDEILPVAISADGSFELPSEQLLRGTFRLMASGTHGTVTIRPFALSAGASRTDFRFGDARLSCEVLWGYMAPSTNFLVRGLFRTVGGCRSRRIGIYLTSERPISDVAITNRPQKIDIAANRLAWRVPLYDRMVPNDARVHVTVE